MFRCTTAFAIAFSVRAMADDLPVPPLPPAQPPAGEVAPTPNPDVQAPALAGPEKPSFNVKFYPVKLYDPSLGFTPGSQYQSTEDRKPLHTPGLTLSVPIQ